ncbi:uncharacterized protein LOC135484329 [Lineus longissimus]|uniref:uncharacterized protein LOC135484329 n=1 Tax=Lineus longissimus TaxID=88925 RepID=UPI00315C4D51
MSFTNYLTFELGILGLLCWCVREQQATTQVGLEILPKLPGSCGYALVAEVGVKKTFTFSVNMRIGMLYRDICKWKFIGENKNRIGYLFVNDFVVFESPGCKKDFVSIRDTDNEQSLIGKYCSPRQIPQTKRTTAGSTLIVNFQSITGFSSRFSIMYWAFEQSERCSATLYLGLRWPKAKAGETVSIRCHTAGDATWLCGQDGKYDPVGPTLDKDCIAQILEETVKGMSSSVKGGRSSMELLQDMMHIADRMLSAVGESAFVVNVQTLAAHTHHNVTFCSDDTPDDGPIVHLHFDDRRDNRSEPITAVIVIYRNMSGMLRLNTSGGFHQDGANMTFERNFMTVSLYQNGSSSKLNATDNIVMSYTIPKTTPGDIGNRHCVFWDGALHGWSDVGCRLTQATHYKTACACDHLTFFAVLMDVSGSSFTKVDEESGDTEKSLAILTYIGCGLSIVCLFISIICFFTLRQVKITSSRTHHKGARFLVWCEY